jgi:hypothetical protein
MRVLKNQHDALLREVTNGEIEDLIKGRLLDLLSCCDGGDISADEVADKAWETENCDGVVFYDNYQADMFAVRHSRWVDDAMEHAGEVYGDSEHYVHMKAECTDRFLVVACILATEYFLYDQVGLDRDEGDLSKTRLMEIKRRIKAASYDGNF